VATHSVVLEAKTSFSTVKELIASITLLVKFIILVNKQKRLGFIQHEEGM
jgi:hypothetical protein